MLIFLIFYAIYYVILKKIFKLLLFGSYEIYLFFPAFATLGLSKNEVLWLWALSLLALQFIPLILFLCKKTRDMCCILSTGIAIVVILAGFLAGISIDNIDYSQNPWQRYVEARGIMEYDLKEKFNETYSEEDVVKELGRYDEKIDYDKKYAIVYSWRDYYYRQMYASIYFDKETGKYSYMTFSVGAEQ